LGGGLSDEQLNRVVEERGNALALRVHEAKQVLSRVDGLLAADQSLIDEINSVIGERQIPGEAELFQFFNHFLAHRFPGCQLPRDVIRKVVDLDLHPISSALESAASEIGQDALFFARRVSTGLVPITLSREAAYNHPRSELLHLQHPMSRFIVSEVARENTLSEHAFAIRLRESALSVGSYAFLIAAVHIKGQRPKTRLVAVFCNRNNDRVWTDPDEMIPVVVQMLEKGEDVHTETPSDDECELLQERLLQNLERLKAEWNTREQTLDQARREQQSAARRTTLEFLTNRAKERMQTLIFRHSGEFAIRMARARFEKARKELDIHLSAPAAPVWDRIEHEDIAVGVLEVAP